MNSKYIFIAILLIVILPVYAMSDASQWAKAIQAVSLVSVEQTLDGGYVAAGSKKYNVSSSKALLVRFDSSGNIQWAKTYQLSNNDSASMVLAMADGGFVFTGSTSSNGGEAFLIKVDSAGNILRQKVYRSPSKWEEASVILRASDGGFFLLGNLAGNSGSDIWCMKLNSKAEISWVRIYGRTRWNEVIAAAVETIDGGLIFAGKDHSGPNAPIVVKIDASGNIIWQKRLSRESGWMVKPTSITATADGGYVVGCNQQWWGTMQGWVAKLDSSGNVSWSKFIPGQYRGVTAVRQENDGHILVIGFIGDRIWSGRFDSQGKLFSQEAFGQDGTSFFQVSGIHGTPDDGTVFVGSRHRNSRRDAVIGRTSFVGEICTEFENYANPLIRDSDLKVDSIHIGSRKGAFEVGKANFVQASIATKILDLCK